MKRKNLDPRVAKTVCLLNVFAQPDRKFLRFVIQEYFEKYFHKL